MGYKVTARVKIDMSDIGEDQNGNGFFVEIQNPRLMVWEQKMAASKFAIPEGKILTTEETKALIDDTKEYVFSFIKAWNFLDLETEQPLDLKSPAVLNKVPSIVVERIMESFKKAQEKVSEEQKN